MKVGHATIFDEEHIANAFNEHYIEVGQKQPTNQKQEII